MNMVETLTISNLRGPKLNQFWIRSLGLSKDFSRIKLLYELQPFERLMAALLRGDRNAAVEVFDVETVSPTLVEQLLKLTYAEAFSSLVYERIFSLDLVGRFSGASILAATYLDEVKSSARFLVSNHFRLDEKFAKVLKITKEFKSDALWVKGAHLSRTVYQPSHFRHYGDLDVIVRPSKFEPFVEALKNAGFEFFDLPAHCNQIGVGPLRRPLDVITAPLSDWIPSGAITMIRKADDLYVDIKVGPFERGLQLVEFERLFVDAEEGACLGNTYLAPSVSDHLMIMLCNFAKSRFESWRTLLDIHLLVLALNRKPDEWKHFVQRCKLESISTNVWVGLSIAADRLSTSVPDVVLRELAPEENFSVHCLTFTVSPAFVWNSTSFPMKILNIYVSSDRKRKISLLARSFFPSARFLCDYYGDRGEGVQFSYLRYLPMHWFVLLMPGGIVRRTLGRLWWSTKSGF
ncbi:MAG: nucleotidyltransferase family protein [Cyanobacteria bacterium SZAS-4]|nr:nucleotidyltransferase family protein [Cyanobacteria bacterium SZAS-4]